MFYRRKIILSMLQLFDGQLEKIRLQKLLFLFSQKQRKAVYDFVPYRFGSYSYSLNADLRKMVENGFLKESEFAYTKTDSTNYLKQLKPDDLQLLYKVKENYGSINAISLMKYTYINFPFYAINSELAENILTKSQLERIEVERPKNNETILFTIGYEGISLEEYLNKLLINNIKLLVDVRKNPSSRKFGFCKFSLQRYCNSLGIGYIHIPEVGIESKKRRQLKTQSDYNRLFTEYRNTILKNTIKEQEQIIRLLKKYGRIALTCFESNPFQCHRLYLANYIKSSKSDYTLKHI